MFDDFINAHKLPDEFINTVNDFYKPLAKRIVGELNKSEAPYFVGINGCQGSGKSTLTDYLFKYLTTEFQLNVVVMSLDDFYLTSDARQQLAKDIHPLLATRGVPGTHDIAALKDTLQKLKTKESNFKIPRFNKATDNPFPESEWTTISSPADIVILEGWCWGISAQKVEELEPPINELEVKHDQSCIWRKFVNQQVEENYQPLYPAMDFWLALQPPSPNAIYKWRLEQEEKLAARNKGLANSKIMSPEQVLNFIQYFQRLSIQGCKTVAGIADETFHLDIQRNITDQPLTEKL